MGPTASGKTDAAAALSDHVDCELVSVDSVQVYRGLDIGSAKPDPVFLERFPHRLINVRNLLDTYSAADFCADAHAAINEIQAAGKLPVLVGGTMFYFAALHDGLSPLPIADPGVRETISRQVTTEGLASLYRELQEVDPEFTRDVRPTDTQRLERGMEIYRITGLPPSVAQAQPRTDALGTRAIKLAMVPANRAALHQRIGERFSQMIEQGLVEEVRGILNANPDAEDLPALRSVGYRQAIDHIRDGSPLDVLIDNGSAATRQLAKRQLTWLRNQPGVTWFNSLQTDAVSALMAYLAANHRTRQFC